MQKLIVFAMVMVLGLAVASGPASALPARYTVTDLGRLPGGTWSRAACINNQGQVVGVSETGDRDALGNRVYRAFLWQNGVTTDLGSLPGSSFASSTAQKINDDGDIVGFAGSDTVGADKRAFLWHAGTMTNRGPAGNQISVANSINLSGQVVGSTRADVDSTLLAWVSDGANTTYLPNPVGQSAFANDINSAGQIVGSVNSGGRAALWNGGVFTYLGWSGSAHAINDRGQVVGDTVYSPGGHAIVWENGHISDIHTITCMNSSALDINNAGVVVGSLQIYDNVFRGFVWQGTGMVDLNTMIPKQPYWRVGAALSINDLGQIVGEGYRSDGMHAILLTPVPEPSSILALLGGLAGLLGLRRRMA